MRQPVRLQAYRNFRLTSFQQWRFGHVDYNGCLFIVMNSMRLFWYNFETVRRLVIRSMRKKLPKRYKIKKVKKKKKWHSYVRPKRYISKLLWVGGISWLPLTMKPRGSRMGHGKGSFKMWFVRPTAGLLIFRVSCLKYLLMRIILKRVAGCIQTKSFSYINQWGRNVGVSWYW